MELNLATDKQKCDIGSCKQRAKYSVKLNRSGIRSTINMCDKCFEELYEVLAKEVVPKSIETLKPKSRGDING